MAFAHHGQLRWMDAMKTAEQILEALQVERGTVRSDLGFEFPALWEAVEFLLRECVDNERFARERRRIEEG